MRTQNNNQKRVNQLQICEIQEKIRKTDDIYGPKIVHNNTMDRLIVNTEGSLVKSYNI